MVNIIVCGAAGKMGSAIIRLVKEDKALKVAGAVESKEFTGKCPAELKCVSSLEEVISSADVVIDFTNPAATIEHLAACVKNKKSIVIGTTGLNDSETDRIKEASKTIPVVFSPNMSIGVNLLFKLVKEAAETIPGYDIEISETHHIHKKDAPSGTAVKLSQIVAESLGKNLKDIAVYGENGVMPKLAKGQLGIMSIRSGEVVGDHTVTFSSPVEKLELTHKAVSRDTLAAGAITAVKWVCGKKPGLYDMQDVLELKGKK